MRKSGFTLMELVIVILVVGILSTVLIADAAKSFSASRLEGARWKLKSDLSYAQSLAVTQQINHGIIFNPASNSYSVYNTSISNIVKDPSAGNDFTVNYNSNADLKGVDLVSTSFGSPTTDRVEFDSFGIPSDGTNTLVTNGSVYLSYAGAGATIAVIKNTGNIN